MKKYIKSAVLATGLLLVAIQAHGAAEILNEDAADQGLIFFTPSNAVNMVYDAGNAGVSIAAGGEPQQYMAASKHTGGTRVFVTTESANLSYVEDDANRGIVLTVARTGLTGVPDFNGYLGENVEVLNAAGWLPL